MARYRAGAAAPPGVRRLDKPGEWVPYDAGAELDVFAAERYFNGDDALWCAGSSSSFSSAFRTGTHERDRSVATATAATSSSEASWNSRSALLPDGKLLVAAAAPSVEAEPSWAGSSEVPGRYKPSPSSNLRRWLLGVAGCACVGGDGEESVSADDEPCGEVEADNVGGIGGKKDTTEVGDLLQRTESEELAVREATAVRVRPGWCLDGGDAFHDGKAAFPTVHLLKDAHRGAINSDEFCTPIVNPATTATFHEQRRKSSEMPRPLGDQGSLLGSATRNSPFTIVAGNPARGGGLHAAVRGGGSPAVLGRPCASRCDSSEDIDAAPSELGCAYPPSEASVVWSVVTAEGAASCNFSSAASGYYYHFNDGEDGAVRRSAGRSNRRRRSGIANGGGLLTCMSDKAVDAIKPAR